MKKKLFFFTIILLIIGFSVYFFALTPMLDDRDKIENENFTDEDEEPAETEEDQHDDRQETDTIAEKVRFVIVDSIKSTFDLFTDQEVNIVAIGDSLTEGIGDSTNRGGYVGILDRTINQDDTVAHFFNHGKKGNRAEQLLKRLDQSKIIDSIQEADIILITIGANDIMQVLKENFTDLTYDQFNEEQKYYEQNLQQILKKIRDDNENAHIYLLGVYNPFGEYFEDIDELNLIVDDWNESGKSLTDQYENITFIPIKDLFVGNEEKLLSEDHFHPNELGYDRMADRVLDYFMDKDRWAP